MKTKKIVFVLLALFFIHPVIYSQKNVEQLFNEFAKEKGVKHVAVGKFTLTLASLFTDVMGVTGVDILSFDECKQSVKNKLNKTLASLKDENYETMVSVNETDERTKILVKMNDEFIQELVVLTTGDDPAIIRIRGKIKLSDIEKVIEKNKQSKE